MDMSSSKKWKIVKDGETLSAAVYGVTKSWTGLGDQKATTIKSSIK